MIEGIERGNRNRYSVNS